MICPACRDRRHEECLAAVKEAPSWCDCQHESIDRPVEPATGYASP
jgi:hypothetical protein